MPDLLDALALAWRRSEADFWYVQSAAANVLYAGQELMAKAAEDALRDIITSTDQLQG